MEHPVLNGMSPLNPSLWGSMNLVKKAERFEEPEGMEDIKETRPSRSTADAPMNSQSLWPHSYSLHGPASDGIVGLKGEWT